MEENQPLLFHSTIADITWLLSKSLIGQGQRGLASDSPISSQSHIPTWAAYHSLLSKSQPITRVCVLPLLQAPASEWSTLLTVLKQAQNINTSVIGPNRKTVITLDMQLYEKAKQLEMAREDCRGKWILRVGELHTVMAALRTAGSFIDDAWVEADLYGPTTTRQILECNHMKRSVTAHVITLQALFSLYQEASSRKMICCTRNVSHCHKHWTMHAKSFLMIWRRNMMQCPRKSNKASCSTWMSSTG